MASCSSSKGSVCKPHAAPTPDLCPECGRKGKVVSLLTVKSLVRDHTRVSPGLFAFCRTPECEVVYYGKTGDFPPDLKVRVGIKEVEDPVPLCYCFGYTRADVRCDIEKHGSTRILENVKAEVQAGFCACEVKNPSGDCCLGDITRAVKEAKEPRGRQLSEMNRHRSVVLKRAACIVFTAALCFIGLGVNLAGTQSDEASIHRGGEATIITGPQKNTLQVQSTRFR